MAGLTLTQARTNVLDHLDDETGARYNGDGTFTKIDVALSSSLSRCVADYVGAAGDNFTEEVTLTTSAVDGTVSMASQGPLDIKDVKIVSGTTSFFKVAPLRRRDIEILDLVARSIVVAFVREFALPTLGANPLVGVGATPANTWPAFDAWVCARAALQLGVKDDELRQALLQLEQDARASALARVRIPRSRDWPMPRARRPSLYEDVHWTYLKSTSTLQLVRAVC